MSSIGPNVRVHLIRLAGEKSAFALVTHKIYAPAFFLSLEYYLLRRVVHAGLANAVRGIGSILRADVCENERPFVYFFQCVARPFRKLLLKSSNLGVELSLIVFERLDLILHRRHLLLRLQRGVLDIEDPFLQRLERIGELRIVTCYDCRFSEIKKCFGAAQGGADRAKVHGGSPCEEKVGVGTTDSTWGANPRPSAKGN